MRLGPVILLIGTAAVVGWLAPDLSAQRTGEPGTAETAAAAQQAQAAEDARREAWLAEATVVNRSSDGHFYLDARVEGRTTRFLVDTGASIVALTGEDARAIGLNWDDSDLVRIGRGASGDVYGVPLMLDTVELDGFRADKVDAAIIPEGLDVSLLGQSFLSRVKGVRIDGSRMILGEE